MPLVVRIKLAVLAMFVGMAIAGLIARWFFGVDI